MSKHDMNTQIEFRATTETDDPQKAITEFQQDFASFIAQAVQKYNSENKREQIELVILRGGSITPSKNDSS